MCLLISPSHTHTYTLTTQSDAHIYCLSDCSSGAPAAEIRSERIPSIFTRNFSSVGRFAATFPPLPLDCCGFLNNRLLAVSNGQSARCQAHPESDLLSPGLLVVIFARRLRRAAGAQTEGKARGGKTKPFRTYSHTCHSDSGLFFAMSDIMG